MYVRIHTLRHNSRYILNREELDRKMDHKRQQIHSGVQEIRQLEQRVNQFRDEKVGHLITTSISHRIMCRYQYQ